SWRRASSSRTITRIARSPDLAPFPGGTDHRRRRRAGERLLELAQVGERADHAVLADGVGVGLHHQSLRLRPDLVAAELAPGDEELLVGREAVDGGRRWLALERL